MPPSEASEAGTPAHSCDLLPRTPSILQDPVVPKRWADGVWIMTLPGCVTWNQLPNLSWASSFQISHM